MYHDVVHLACSVTQSQGTTFFCPVGLGHLEVISKHVLVAKKSLFGLDLGGARFAGVLLTRRQHCSRECEGMRGNNTRTQKSL